MRNPLQMQHRKLVRGLTPPPNPYKALFWGLSMPPVTTPSSEKGPAVWLPQSRRRSPPPPAQGGPRGLELPTCLHLSPQTGVDKP